MVLQIYHQTSEAAILVSATARVVGFASSFKRWKTPLYSVCPRAMSSTVLSRCHSLSVLPGIPLISTVQISVALMFIGHKGPGLHSKKLTKVGDVKRHLRIVSTALHIRLELSPIKDPTEAYFNRFFFALDFDRASGATSVAL